MPAKGGDARRGVGILQILRCTPLQVKEVQVKGGLGFTGFGV